MPENIRFSSPDTMQKPPGYSHVVEVTGPGRTIYFAGQLGIDKSGKMGANARDQMEIAFANVKQPWIRSARASPILSSLTPTLSISAATSRIIVKCATNS
jgi:hypothetical protein